MSNFNKWVSTFLEEKNLPFKSFTIEHNGEQHIIDTDFIIDLIKNCSDAEQASIKNTIVKIDFNNGDVNHFFEHLATGYIKTNY